MCWSAYCVLRTENVFDFTAAYYVLRTVLRTENIPVCVVRDLILALGKPKNKKKKKQEGQHGTQTAFCEAYHHACVGAACCVLRTENVFVFTAAYCVLRTVLRTENIFVCVVRVFILALMVTKSIGNVGKRKAKKKKKRVPPASNAVAETSASAEMAISTKASKKAIKRKKQRLTDAAKQKADSAQVTPSFHGPLFSCCLSFFLLFLSLARSRSLFSRSFFLFSVCRLIFRHRFPFSLLLTLSFLSCLPLSTLSFCLFPMFS